MKGRQVRSKRLRPSDSSFWKVVQSRRSVRAFSPEIVPKRTLLTLMESVQYAPSSLGDRPWEMVLVTKPTKIRQVVEFKNKWCPPEKKAYRADFALGATALIVLCVDEKRSHGRALENGLIASAYLLLSATALGLGTTFLTAYNAKHPQQEREFRKLLKIPKRVTPVSILPIGYPATNASPRKRRARRVAIRYETF